MSQEYCGDAIAELPMTLAVGLMGSDGWVLASDKRLYENTGTLQPDGKIITGSIFSRTPKIHWVPEIGVAYTFAGDHASLLAGEALVADLKTNDCLPSARGTLLNRIGNQSWQSHMRDMAQANLKRDLLVIFTKPAPVQMWTVGLSVESTPSQHEDIALIGDTSNGAKIFPLLYYSQRSVKELKVLAAHTILMGHQCAQSLVEGLEMWTGTPDVKTTPPDELQELAKRSDKIDRAICRQFKVAVHRSTQIL